MRRATIASLRQGIEISSVEPILPDLMVDVQPVVAACPREVFTLLRYLYPIPFSIALSLDGYEIALDALVRAAKLKRRCQAAYGVVACLLCGEFLATRDRTGCCAERRR